VYWDRLFAPSSALAVITTVDAAGRVNAASYGTCTRVHHSPMYISFTCNSDRDTARNLEEVGEFVVNLPSFDRESLEKVRVVGLPFARGINELEKANLKAIQSVTVRPPRIADFSRHFECKLEWVKDWGGLRRMVVGKVTAASVDDDCVDENGFVLWDRVKPAHFCGAPYHNMFVAAYQTMSVEVPYEGPEVDAYNASEHSMFAELERVHKEGA
jgi:flavin reductase (DIM6/NTAB) family NADH-FMN oxidoreductase RutF